MVLVIMVIVDYWRYHMYYVTVFSHIGEPRASKLETLCIMNSYLTLA